MKEKAVEKEEEKANVAWFLASLSKMIHKAGYYAESAATIETAFALQPDDEDIQIIKKEIDSENMIHTKLKELEKDISIDSRLTEMLDFELHHLCDDKDCLECKITQFFFELDVVVEIETFRKDILQLKNSYPELYNLKKEFFDTVLNRKKEEYLVTTYRKKYSKYEKLCPERFDTDDDEEEDFQLQPYRRPEPKIGRNDPCPCGSGKKYKKCCGNS